jgi:type VI secretion system protein ImpH
MAKAPDGPVPPVIRDLRRHPQQYSFIQAVRLLSLWADPRTTRDREAFLRGRLRFRPALSLAFAAADIAGLDLKLTAEDGDGPSLSQALITATFLGLYGASSPLPKFYTERLLEEQAEDKCVTRDFLDIFNSEFLLLHVFLSSRVRPLHRHLVVRDPKAGRMLLALAGFGETALRRRLPDERSFLRYAGFFSQAARPASGLRAILADASGCAKTRLRANIPRLARIPGDQRLRLGRQAAILGEEATLGEAVPCYEGKMAVEFDALDEENFRNLLPGTRLAGLLHALIRNYCRQTLEYAVTARLLPGEARALRLGGYGQGRFASLGRDAWLGFGGDAPSAPLPGVTADFPAGFRDAGNGAAYGPQ